MKGKYINSNFVQGEEEDEVKLVLTLTEAGQKEKEELFAAYRRQDEGEDQYKLFETLTKDLVEEGEFKMIHPSKVGHFFDGVIVGVNVDFDEEGNINETDDSIYYCYHDSINTDPFEVLYETGEIYFIVAE